MADSDDASQTPRAPRVPVAILIHYRYESVQEFVAEYTDDISMSGVFIRSDKPRPIGSMIYLQMTLNDGSKLIEGFGRVARVGVGSRGQFGMGVQFLRFDDESKALIEILVETRLSK
jgi:uncharacterized protein (TIGR02266 family)